MTIFCHKEIDGRGKRRRDEMRLEERNDFPNENAIFKEILKTQITNGNKTNKIKQTSHQRLI
jgi:hypothetical protein